MGQGIAQNHMQQPQDKLQGFSTMGLGPGYYGESNVQPSPGQFHMCGATTWLVFGTKADSDNVCQSHEVFECSRAWHSSIDTKKKQHTQEREICCDLNPSHDLTLDYCTSIYVTAGF